MSSRSPETKTLVAGLVTVFLGLCLLLEQTGDIDLEPGWIAVIGCAAAGIALVAAGLGGRPR